MCELWKREVTAMSVGGVLVLLVLAGVGVTVLGLIVATVSAVFRRRPDEDPRLSDHNW